LPKSNPPTVQTKRNVTALKIPSREVPSSIPQSLPTTLPTVQTKRNVSISKQNKASSGGDDTTVTLDPFQDPLAYLAHEKEKKDLEEGNMQAITDYFDTMQQQKQAKADIPSKAAGRIKSGLDVLNGFHDFEHILSDKQKKRHASYLNPPSKN
jgi:hypothetical protein